MNDWYTAQGYRWRAWLLIGAALLVNLVVGSVAHAVLHLPLWLDAIGTILVGALLGPLAGAGVGVTTSLILGLFTGDHVALPFVITAAFIGWAAGYAALLGAFERLWRALLTGLLVGIGAAVISAPIATYVFGERAGAGATYLADFLNTAGATIYQLVTVSGLIRDPLDKVISSGVAWLLWRPLHPYFPPLAPTGIQPLEALKGYTLAVVASLLTTLLLPSNCSPTKHRNSRNIWRWSVSWPRRVR